MSDASHSVYNFNLKYFRSSRDTIDYRGSELSLPTFDQSHSISLIPKESDKSISDSKNLILRGSGWKSDEEAMRFGKRYSAILSRTYARLRMGADYGSRAIHPRDMKNFIHRMEYSLGSPVICEIHGLMTYDATQNARMVYYESPNFFRLVNLDQFNTVFSTALIREREIPRNEQISLEFFNASLFQKSPDAQFMLLMSALEALIEQRHETTEFVDVINRLNIFISSLDEISHEQRDRLRQRVGNLKNESIGQAGRRYVNGKLPGRTYLGMPADRFFTRVYESRSCLIHARDPIPKRDDIETYVHHLELMVSDLLSTDLLDI